MPKKKRYIADSVTQKNEVKLSRPNSFYWGSTIILLCCISSVHSPVWVVVGGDGIFSAYGIEAY